MNKFWIRYLSIVLICILIVFVPNMYHDKKSLNSRTDTLCGVYVGDTIFEKSHRVTIPFFHILLPDGKTVSFRKNLSLSQYLSFLLWGDDLKRIKLILANMRIGQSYCVVFSIDYYEENSPVPVPYLIGIKIKE